MYDEIPVKLPYTHCIYIQLWPSYTLYIYAVYDRIYDEIPVKVPYIHTVYIYIYIQFWPTLNVSVFSVKSLQMCVCLS